MKKLALLAAAALLFTAACTKSEKTPGSADTTAPNFTLQGLDGGSVTLRALKGKVVLIEFWATWCPPCRASLPASERIYSAYHGKGLVILGVSLDSGDWDAVKVFRNDFGITFPILKGDDEVSQNYQVRTIPMFVLVDREGNIRKRYLGSGNEDEIEKEIKALLGN